MAELAWMKGASSFLEVWGMLEQGKAARIQGERAKAVADFNAYQAEQGAKSAIAISQHRAMEEKRQGGLVASRALAVAAASGAGVSDPTIVRLIANARGEGTYRANVALYEGEHRARQLRIDAAAGRISGSEAQIEGATRQEGYAIGALGKGLGGAESLYARYGMNGPGSGDNALVGRPSYLDAGSGGAAGMA